MSEIKRNKQRSLRRSNRAEMTRAMVNWKLSEERVSGRREWTVSWHHTMSLVKAHFRSQIYWFLLQIQGKWSGVKTPSLIPSETQWITRIFSVNLAVHILEVRENNNVVRISGCSGYNNFSLFCFCFAVFVLFCFQDKRVILQKWQRLLFQPADELRLHRKHTSRIK